MRILTCRIDGEIPRTDEENLHYSLEIIKSSCYYLSSCKTSNQSRALRPFLVYCFRNFNGKVLPLNRDYKPLGFIPGRWIKYEDFEFLMFKKELINNFDKISNEQGYAFDVFTWTDGCSPFLDSNTRKKYLTFMQELLT